MNADQVIREQLVHLLTGHNAHLSTENVLNNFPLEHINAQLPNVDYTPWQLLEHIRIAQWDIFEFVNNPDHVSPEWPKGYWPTPGTRVSIDLWKQTVQLVLTDLRAVVDMIKNSDTDFYSPLPHAAKYTIFREILLIADHNAYHVGQLVIFMKSKSA